MAGGWWLAVQAAEVWAHLHDMWTEVEVSAGDTVNVLGGKQQEHEGMAHITLDYQHGFLILHPDVLLSGGHGGRGHCPLRLHASHSHGRRRHTCLEMVACNARDAPMMPPPHSASLPLPLHAWYTVVVPAGPSWHAAAAPLRVTAIHAL